MDTTMIPLRFSPTRPIELPVRDADGFIRVFRFCYKGHLIIAKTEHLFPNRLALELNDSSKHVGAALDQPFDLVFRVPA